MRRRLIVAAVGAAIMLLAAAPAFARHDAASAEPFGWDLQLRNTVSTQYNTEMTYKAFATWAASHQVTVVDNNKTPDNPADDVTYKGVSLKTLVGYFDDQDPTTFNAALATAGYNVVITGMEGFAGTLASADIASLGDKVILANLANDQPLIVPKATLNNGAASWKPNWPLKVVSNEGSVTGKMKPGGVVRVSIVSATAPNAPAEPFAWDLQLRNTMTAKYGADMTSSQWAAWAAKAGRTVTITDSTVPTATVAYKGVALKTLVGYFDDKNRSTFNTALAKKGYWVTILGMDGFSESFKGADIAKLGNQVIVASLGNDAPLPVPKPYVDSSGVAVWVPDWPLRVVSNVPAVGKDTKTQGIVRISIVKKLPVGSAPF
jgi:hypothetical protein